MIAFDVNTTVVQVASFGPYSTNVIVPVGAAPPDNVAVSVSTVPIGPPPEAAVTIVGVVFPMSALSPTALHAADTALLLASPL